MNNKRGEIFFLSGLPRTGSTLLTSILSQNPEIHTQGNSALCQLMWDAQVSCWNTEQMKNTPQIPARLIKSIPDVFYENIDKQIVDKCRSWTLASNLDLIRNYITPSPKIIVMVRPISEIVKSFAFIRKMNGWTNPEINLLNEGSEPIMRSMDGVKNAKTLNDNECLFIWYSDLITEPQKTLSKIYEFNEWKSFQHSFDNITNLTPERDDLLNLIGLHDIRPKLSLRNYDFELSLQMTEAVKLLDAELFDLVFSK